MKTKLPLCLLFMVFICFHAHAQRWMQSPYMKATPDSLGNYNFYDIQKAFERYERKHEKESEQDEVVGEEDEGKFPGYTQFKRWEAYMAPRVYPSGDITLPSTRQRRFNEYLSSNFRQGDPSNTTLAGNWVPLGPTGTHWGGYFGGAARVSFLRIDPANSNIMWTFAPSGGLWKTTDGGQNWTTNTDQLPIIGCTDLAINPLNTQIMYLATGDGNGNGSQLWQSSIGILKSTDGGATWPVASNTMNWQVSWNRCIYKLLINPVNPNIVFAATTNGLYRTLDAGLNWNIVQGGGLFTDVEFKPGNPGVVYATSGVQANGTFYKSTDGGSTFASTAVGLPSVFNVARLDIAVTAADTNSVYVVAVKKNTNDFYGFYRSVDGGDNFTLRSNAPNILAGIPASQAWYNLAIGVSAFHKDTIIVGGTESWRSMDGGVTWTKHTSNTGAGAPFIHPDMHDMQFLPGTDSVYFLCNDGGVWKTTDYGATWSPINEGLQISQMYRLGTYRQNPYTIATGHQDMASHRLRTNSWDIITPNTGDGMECIFEYDNDTVIYLESYNGRIIKAINTFPLFNIVCTFSGAGVNAAGNWVTPVVMHPVFDTILLVGKLQVWRTINGGTSFTQVGNISATGGNMVALAYAPSNPDFIYAAKANHFYVATDGNTFTERSAGLPVPASQITAVAVSNTQPEKVWVTFSGYNSANKVWTSSDTGLTWSNYSTGLPNLPVNCIVYQNNSNNALYAGTDVGIYFICDSLPSWQAFYNGLPNVDVEELEIAYSINKIRAATSGRGLWESDLGVITATSLPVEMLSFAGHHDQNKNVNELEWVTSSERNCDYFEIMKSADAGYFSSIGKVNGSGNSSQQRNYYFADSNLDGGTNYYYLSQVDFDGDATLSKTISIRSDEARTVAVFPNPATATIQFQFIRKYEDYALQLFDVLGNEMWLQPVLHQQRGINDELDVSFLNAGLYVLKITDNKTGEFYYGRFVKK